MNLINKIHLKIVTKVANDQSNSQSYRLKMDQAPSEYATGQSDQNSNGTQQGMPGQNEQNSNQPKSNESEMTSSNLSLSASTNRDY